MRALLAPAAALLALAEERGAPPRFFPKEALDASPLKPPPESKTLAKAVIFEEVKPLYRKTDAGYEGLGVDVLEQIRIQAKRRKVDYRWPSR